MVERRIPNPMVGGSNPSCPARFLNYAKNSLNFRQEMRKIHGIFRAVFVKMREFLCAV